MALAGVPLRSTSGTARDVMACSVSSSSCASRACSVRIFSSPGAIGCFGKAKYRDELYTVGEPCASLRVGSGGFGVRLRSEPVGLFHPLKSSFDDKYASSSRKRNSRTATVTASVEEGVKGSGWGDAPTASFDSLKADPPSPSTSTANSPLNSGGKISSIVSMQSSIDSKTPGSAQDTSAARKPALSIGAKQPNPVGQLSPKSAEQLKVSKTASVFTQGTGPAKPGGAKPASPFATGAAGGASPNPASPFPQPGTKPGSPFVQPSRGKRVVDAFKGEKEGKETKSGQPVVPANIFQDVKRTPKELGSVRRELRTSAHIRSSSQFYDQRASCMIQKWNGGHKRAGQHVAFVASKSFVGSVGKEQETAVHMHAGAEGGDHEKGSYRLQKDGGRGRAGRHATSIALQVDRFKLTQDIEKLSRKESKLLPEALVEALQERIRAGEVENALKVFELLRRQVWYVPQQSQYLSLLKLLAECKQCYHSSELWHCMEEDKLPPSVEICTALLNAYVKSEHLDEAFEVLELMKSTPNCFPDVYTYTILIEGLLQVNKIDRVVLLMDEMEQNEVHQNTVTWNTLLESFRMIGKLELIEDAFKNMCSNPATPPDIYTWNIILKAHGRLGRIRKMEEWYSKMQEMEVPPDVITFNILIHVYGRNREFEKMRNVAQYMLSLYFQWNNVTFNSMIEAYGRARMIMEMEVIYRIMKAKGVKPTAFTLTTLFSAYSKEGMWDKVEKIRREWKNSDIRPDVIMYNSLLEAYRRSGNLRKLEETFAELEYLLEPDQTSYGILANAYRSNGMKEKYNEVAALVTRPLSTRGRGRKLLPSAVEQHARDKGFPADRIFSPQKAGEEPFLEELKD